MVNEIEIEMDKSSIDKKPRATGEETSLLCKIFGHKYVNTYFPNSETVHEHICERCGKIKGVRPSPSYINDKSEDSDKDEHYKPSA